MIWFKILYKFNMMYYFFKMAADFKKHKFQGIITTKHHIEVNEIVSAYSDSSPRAGLSV